MKLFIMSDLHLELHKDLGKSFIDAINKNDADVLILAGDISSSVDGSSYPIEFAISELSKKFDRILYVEGNHEFYFSSRQVIYKQLSDIQSKYKNVTWLHNKVIEIEGTRFLGTPLWFRKPAKFSRFKTNDFHNIKDFEEWVYNENKDCVDFLVDELKEGDVVISHYLPSFMSVHYQFKYENNDFFVCNVEPLILERNPKLWVHGHTHESMDVNIGKTRVVCNPYGYKDYMTNFSFKDNFILEI